MKALISLLALSFSSSITLAKRKFIELSCKDDSCKLIDQVRENFGLSPAAIAGLRMRAGSIVALVRGPNLMMQKATAIPTPSDANLSVTPRNIHTLVIKNMHRLLPVLPARNHLREG